MKIYPTTGHEIPEGENKYISSVSITLALDGSRWSMSRSGCFNLLKEFRYPITKGWVRTENLGSNWMLSLCPPTLYCVSIPTTLSRSTM